MPRKPKRKKREVQFRVGDETIATTLYPPADKRKTWYVYWPGLGNPKSTGQKNLQDAIAEVEEMLNNGGRRRRRDLSNLVLTDEEFVEIQKRHYAKKQDPVEKGRAAQTLKACLEAMDAFKQISGLDVISTATPDDCARFQHQALSLPKNWRSKYPRSRENVETLSPNTVVKWSVALRAAFERVNRNAERRKCVRGVVPQEKLLTENPWKQFTWIEGRKPTLRQFDSGELTSFLDYLDEKWPGVAVAPLMAKVCLWSWGRKKEVAGLTWDSLRVVGGEYHFEIVGKWGVDKWFRLPDKVYNDLIACRTDSPYVFAAYSQQLRDFHQRSSRPWIADNVLARFDPKNFGDWFYDRVVAWSASLPKGAAYIHVFRKTTLQYARSGEDVNRQVAADARVSERVMMASYAKETDQEMRQRSNRTFLRIANSLTSEVAIRYGYTAPSLDPLVDRLNEAVAALDWPLVARITAELERRDRGREVG